MMKKALSVLLLILAVSQTSSQKGKRSLVKLEIIGRLLKIRACKK